MLPSSSQQAAAPQCLAPLGGLRQCSHQHRRRNQQAHELRCSARHSSSLWGSRLELQCDRQERHRATKRRGTAQVVRAEQVRQGCTRGKLVARLQLTLHGLLHGPWAEALVQHRREAGAGRMARVVSSVTCLHALLHQTASGPSAEVCGKAASCQPSWMSALHLGHLTAEAPPALGTINQHRLCTLSAVSIHLRVSHGCKVSGSHASCLTQLPSSG